jgi:hypothetical protein
MCAALHKRAEMSCSAGSIARSANGGSTLPAQDAGALYDRAGFPSTRADPDRGGEPDQAKINHQSG